MQNTTDDETTQASVGHIRDSILEGNIDRAAWSLSWPSALAMFLQTTSNNIDRFFVARLGSELVAALGLSNTVLMMVFATIVAISTATTALVARFHGARETLDAEQAARQSLYFSVVAALVIWCIFLPLAGPAVRLMAGKSTSVPPLSLGYLHISLIGLPPLFVLTVQMAAFRGLGDMMAIVRITLATSFLTALLDWLLIFGNLGFPALGLNGAAWAATITRFIVLIYALKLLGESSLSGAMRRIHRPDFSWFRRIIRLGLPAGLQSVLRTGSSIMFFAFLGRLPNGEAAMAALTIGLGVEAFAFMPGFAFSTAAAAMVGQNLGAKTPGRAKEAAWACARQSVGVMTIMGVAVFFLADPVAKLFSSDPEVVRLTSAYLKINAISEPFIALSMTFSGALQGAGDTRSPTLVTFVSHWLLRLPLTYLLAIHLVMGTLAAWWVMAGTMMLTGILIMLVFMSGRWRHQEV